MHGLDGTDWGVTTRRRRTPPADRAMTRGDQNNGGDSLSVRVACASTPARCAIGRGCAPKGLGLLPDPSVRVIRGKLERRLRAVAVGDEREAGRRTAWSGHLVASSVTQQRDTDEARTYIDRKITEGKTRREARRAHKRQLANRAIRRMWKRQTRNTASPTTAAQPLDKGASDRPRQQTRT